MNESAAFAGSRRLVLVGAGHVHLEIVRRILLSQPPNLRTTVVSPDERHFYSGMTPGYLAGQYAYDDLTSDVPAIAARAGVECAIGRAVGLDPELRRVGLEDGRELPYDLASLNIGSLLAGARTGAARHAQLIKPLHRAAEVRRKLDELAGRADRRDGRVVVVGAGAAGFEVACACRAALVRAGHGGAVTIVDASDRVLDGYADRLRARGRDALRRLGIELHLGCRVESVEPDGVRLNDGSSLPSDLTIWLTGPEGAPLLAESGLPVDERGFLLTTDTLQSVADPHVFAVGDCGTLAPYPATPKAGVYAVREAPVLWRNLVASLDGGALERYRPQSGFLSILNTCDGRALLSWKGIVTWSRWAWWLKDRIDRRFMRRYQRLAA